MNESDSIVEVPKSICRCFQSVLISVQTNYPFNSPLEKRFRVSPAPQRAIDDTGVVSRVKRFDYRSK